MTFFLVICRQSIDNRSIVPVFSGFVQYLTLIFINNAIKSLITEMMVIIRLSKLAKACWLMLFVIHG